MLLIWVAPAFGQSADNERYWKKDAIALRQEVDSFNTLEDGQPAAPGDWEMQLGTGWRTTSGHADPALIEPVLKYTPHRYTTSGYEFFEHSQLRLRMPMQLGIGRREGNGDLAFGFQERWMAEEGLLPTIATLAEIRIPNGYHSNDADGTFTAILDKDIGPGTAICNGWMKTANGEDIEDLRRFQWGFRLGYKWRFADRAALITDYVHQISEQRGHGNLNQLELSAEFRTKHHLAFGPGLFVGLDGHDETPHFGAGFKITYLFNARNPPEE
jgi:hypothetical protein